MLFGTTPSRRSPDLERLLLDTVRLAPTNARLFVLAVTWLSQYANFVARHRLKRLVLTELEPEARPVLGLILDLAIQHGAAGNLNIAANVCGKATPPRPLFDIHASSDTRRQFAQRAACAAAKRRDLWTADVDLKLDALRPASWILEKNPSFRERAIRKGDLRATILETLRHDIPGHEVPSELTLVNLTAANHLAVSAALDDLELEGACHRRPNAEDRRRHQVQLLGP